jgi:YidC/Oxa1 family membrane protein insertase
VNPWTALLDLLGTILAFFYSLVPNYGVAIILLTLLIGAITFPLTLKQTRSMRAMQAIQGDVKKLQAEYKHDRQELNQRLMALYQENNVNPASGCLPLLVQMPIWFALFSVLRTPDRFPAGSALFTVIREPAAAIATAADAAAKWAIDIPGNLKILGLNLLVSPSDALSGGGIGAVIPYAILIVIVAASSYYQQYQTQKRRTDDPAGQTPQAQGMQTALKIMPLFFAFISFNFITGLVLYFATSNLFRIGQQAVIIGLDDREQTDDDGGSSGGSDADAEEQRRSGTNPNTSKKRNRRRRK